LIFLPFYNLNTTYIVEVAISFLPAEGGRGASKLDTINIANIIGTIVAGASS
jgi:hypothetical protein